MSQSVVRNIQQSVAQHGANLAFQFEGQSYTYHDFKLLVGRIAHQIQALTPQPQQVIAVYATNSIETYASILAIWFTGNIYFPVNPQHPASRIATALHESQASILLTSCETPAELKTVSLPKINTKQTVENSNFHFVEGEVLYMLQTSGSTGSPKLVPISSQNLSAYAEGYLELHPKIDTSDCFLQTYEFTSDAFFSGFVIPLLRGASIATLNDRLVKPMAVLRALTQFQVTWVKMTPSLLSMIDGFLGKLDLSKLRYAQFGGEQLQPEMLRNWRKAAPKAQIANSYGPTETTVTSSIHIIFPEENLEMAVPISIGKPFKHVDYQVIDENNTPCQAKQKGELVIGGLQTMQGYTNRPNDKKVFAELEGRPYYRTGDRVWFNESGLFFFADRIDFQLKYNGYRIEPGEIEAILMQMTLQRAVVKLQDGKLTAFVETNEIDPQWISALKTKLPQHMIPTEWIAVSAFPVTLAGKIDREALHKS